MRNLTQSVDDLLTPPVENYYILTAIKVIIINQDKLELILLKNSKHLENKYLLLSPLGIVFSLTVALLTATFANPLILAIFIVVDVFFCISSINLGIRYWKSHLKENILDQIEREAKTVKFDDKISIVDQ